LKFLLQSAYLIVGFHPLFDDFDQLFFIHFIYHIHKSFLYSYNTN
jgi:hypothetical protein